jgi:zinc transport system ATP-binding protein
VVRSKTKIINEANFTVNSGDYVGVVGPNGGGKTSLILALLGTIPVKKGSIRLFGKDIKSFSSWDRLAYVSQDAINFDSQFPLSVKELVGLGRVNRKNLGRKLSTDDWEAVDQAMEYMDLTKIANNRIGELSGGQKQRLFVAKALVRNPDIIFLDEPVAGIDAVTQEKFYMKLSDLNAKSKKTILIVSHDLSAVFCRMSKIICVNRDVYISNIVEDELPEDILRKTYGEHFHFVYHKHECEGVFNNGRIDIV